MVIARGKVPFAPKARAAAAAGAAGVVFVNTAGDDHFAPGAADDVISYHKLNNFRHLFGPPFTMQKRY